MSMFLRIYYMIYQADVIRVKVGYPVSPDTDNPRSIAQYYNNVKVDKNDFFGNVLSSACVLDHFLQNSFVTYCLYKG